MAKHEIIFLGLGVLLIAAVVLYEAFIQNGLKEKLRSAEWKRDMWESEYMRIRVEMETVMQRDAARLSHQVHIRDQQIEDLQDQLENTIRRYESQLRQKDKQYKLLEDLLNKNWPKAAKK